MKLQHEFYMARKTIGDVKPLPAERRCREYLMMLEKAEKEQKERTEDAE